MQKVSQIVKMNKETEYEKDINELKEQILKEGNILLTKRDLLERFCEIDKEYNGRPWNLLQILANINILIGEEPRTGHWRIVPYEETMFCSECNCRLSDEQTYLPLNYCPNCGAKMIGSRERSDKE